MNSKSAYLLLSVGMLVSPLSLAGGLSNEQINAYYEAWSSGNDDTVMSYFADSIVYEDVATEKVSSGPTEVRAFATKFLDSAPGVKITPTSILVGDTSAAVEWTMSAGEGDEAWSVRGVAILNHAGGKITRATDYWDAE